MSTCFHSLQTGKRIARSGRENINAIQVRFPFPSNGKADPKKKPFKGATKVAPCLLFPFPSNGKADPKRPHFKPSGAVGPKAQNQTRTARGNFFTEILAPNSRKPACTLDQTRFFCQNGPKVRGHLSSWAFFTASGRN